MVIVVKVALALQRLLNMFFACCSHFSNSQLKQHARKDESGFTDSVHPSRLFWGLGRLGRPVPKVSCRLAQGIRKSVKGLGKSVSDLP